VSPAVADVEHTLDELIALGGTRLASRWPGVAAMRALAGDLETADDAERQRLAEELRSIANTMYGGYGSFLDFGIDGHDADRFERLKDELSSQIGRL
jgi:hypothetical protein